MAENFLKFETPPGADAPREVQRVWRMKIEYNKLLAKLKVTKEEAAKLNIEKHMREIYSDLVAAEHEAVAVSLRKNPVGANIELPLSEFKLQTKT